MGVGLEEFHCKGLPRFLEITYHNYCSLDFYFPLKRVMKECVDSVVHGISKEPH